MELEIVLTKAKNLGFSCQLSQERAWQIMPISSQESWLLTQNRNGIRWILSINNVPQLNLITSEVLDFLENRYQNQKSI